MTPFPPIALTTDRIRLRLLGGEDIASLFAIYSDPEVLRYWSHSPWLGHDQARAMLARDSSAYEAGTALRLGIELLADRSVVGTVALFNLDLANRRGEIGYALSRAHWGRGLMHEALSLFVDWLFDACNLHRLEADIDPGNLASARSLRRLGFQREGLLRERWIVDGKVSDTELYGLLAAEWRGNHRAD